VGTRGRQRNTRRGWRFIYIGNIRGGRSFKTMSMGLSVAKLGCESSSANHGIRNPCRSRRCRVCDGGVGILMSMLLDLRVGTGGCTTAERDGAG